MASDKPMISAARTSLSGFRVQFEVKDVPIQFANAIRRILLNEMPVVEVTDVQIIENTTLMPHEMLRLRTELLPVNVRATEEDVIRSAKLTLRAFEPGKITTDNFGITGGRNDIILKDRDLDTPLYFLKLKKDEVVNLTASLRVNPLSSHVCVATYSYHVDPEKEQVDKEKFLLENPGGEDLFQNFYRQRSFHTNEKGRPDWFDFTVESIGVIPATELVKDALTILKKRIVEWVKTDIVRENEANVYMIESDSEGHTLGSLIQAVLYESGMCDFVSYDVPHPLRSEMRVRFLTERTTEEILSYVSTKVAGYCDTCLGIL
jgi:hypothetical protein